MLTRRAGRFHVILLALLSTAPPLLAPAQGTVSVSLLDVPAVGSPPQVSLRVAYQKAPDVAEKRLVFQIEARRTDNDAVLDSVVLDNQGHGYTSASGEIPCVLTLPPDPAFASVYFFARVCPWSLNRAIVSQYKSYPTDGTYTYAWTSGSYGVTQDLYYLGTLIAPTNAAHTTYCSGITFETFMKAYETYNTAWGHSQIGTMSTAQQMKNFRLVWYGVTDADRLSAKAISDYALGEPITDWEEVQEGDIVQIWRHSGSGHSVIFVSWVRDDSQVITGFNYWSTQTSTNGIGSRSEFFGETTGVNPARFWPARLRKPRDAADAAWALGETDTQSSPTAILKPASGWMMY